MWVFTTARSPTAITPPISLLDPNPSMVGPNGNLLTNLTLLTQLPARVGTVTDGVSKLLLVTQSTTPLNFTLTGAAATAGTLTNLNGAPATGIKPVAPFDSQNSALGTVVAVYTPSDGYGNYSGALSGRSVTVTVTDPGNTIPPRSVEIKLLPPPVVLVHGMWSSPAVWKIGGFVSFLEGRGYKVPDSQLADYSQNSASTFDPQRPGPGVNAVYAAVVNGVENYHKQQIACAQVDVVAHSLGGLMTRSFSQQGYYKNNINFYKGYVHRLITLGTPHLGSPLGPLLIDARNSLVYLQPLLSGVPSPKQLEQLLVMSKMPIGQCHEDFAASSAALQHLNALVRPATIPTHAIAGSYAPLSLPAAYGFPVSVATLFGITPELLFNGQDNDWIVPVTSQLGGLPGSATSLVFPATVHSTFFASVTETNSTAIQQEVIQLLSIVGNSTFVSNRMSPPLDQTTSAFAAKNTTAVARSLSGDPVGSIQLTTPTSGAVYAHSSSTTVKLAFKPSSGLDVTSSFFAIEGIGPIAPAAQTPYTTTVTLPIETPVGRLNVIAFARDRAGNIYADTTHILVQPNAPLQALRVSPDTVRLDSLIRQYPLSVRSTYFNGKDSVYVNLTTAGTGTQYAVTTTGGVVRVSSNGVVEAIKPGKGIVQVTYGTKKVLVPVVVKANFATAKYRPNAVSFPQPADQRPNTMFALAASATSGEPVAFSVVSGPATLKGSIVTVTGVGQVNIRASQSGNVYYQAAPDVLRTFNVSIITSTSSPLLEQLVVYPNPAATHLTIELPLGIQTQSLALLDMQGRLVVRTIPASGAHQVQLDVSHLSNGLYILEVQTSHGLIHQRVVKE